MGKSPSSRQHAGNTQSLCGALPSGRLSKLLWLWISALMATSGVGALSAADGLPKPGEIFPAKDTLNCDRDAREDAQNCLDGLRWSPGDFAVTCEMPREDQGDLLIRFPTPVPTGDGINDNVSMEWYVARDAERKPKSANCVIVVHESGRGMTVGRIFARGLNSQGLHTFLVHMPGYGVRRSAESDKPERIITGMRQAIADVRRARDAAVTLPLVKSEVVGLQGTSLGGFITSTTAGLDNGFDRVFILLAGGNLHEVVLNGKRDAAQFRQRLESIGVRGDQIRELARPVEPMRVAHRLNPSTTWLYSGQYDDVVPPACSKALAKAANLPDGHHIEMAADHYSGILYLPAVIAQIRSRMEKSPDSGASLRD